MEFINYDLLLIFYFLMYICIIYGNYHNLFFNLIHECDKLDEELIKNKVDDNTTIISDEQTSHEIKREIPYEEKYLTQMRNMVNEYVFTDEELVNEQRKLLDLIQNKKNSITNDMAEINNKLNELTNNLRNLHVSQDKDNDDYHDVDIDSDSVINKCKDKSLTKPLENSIQNEIAIHNLKLNQLQNTLIDEEEFKKQARQFIIDEQLQKYKKSFIIENTPLGNVLMFYNHDKLTFDYYSDVTIPYRFLETVARKYVVTHRYRPLYIDMEEELKNYEKKLDQIEQDTKERENRINTNENNSGNDNVNNGDNMDNENDKDKKKKNVFAKFKTYNKEAGTGKVNMAPPPKNSIPQARMNVNLNDSKKDKDGKSEKILLKERSNRYSYQGKIANFNILQKIDRKKVDKKFALTFADFKKLQMNNKLSNSNN
jgi:hypothetical protein